MRLSHHPRRRGLAGEGGRHGGGRTFPTPSLGGGGRDAAGDCTEPHNFRAALEPPAAALDLNGEGWGGGGVPVHSPQPGPSISPWAGKRVGEKTGQTLMISNKPAAAPLTGGGPGWGDDAALTFPPSLVIPKRGSWQV